MRGVGNVYFDSKDGRWIVFKHVKEPQQIVQSGLGLSGTPTHATGLSSVTIVELKYGQAFPNVLHVVPTCDKLGTRFLHSQLGILYAADLTADGG
ncbi:MAG TPA: hypothetical protein VNA15_02740 [Candidatus Angelobacter sp.]|nr:hypothetical protein [Candidatus Angelobacter sp.]